MGKASRAKHDRRDAPVPPPAPPRSFPVFWVVVVLVAIAAGVAAIVATRSGETDDAADAAAANVPTFADVRVDGDELPAFSATGDDAAVGERVPWITGEDFDGMKRSLAPDDGVARAYVVVAHWCPHCQDEVPRLVEWSKQNELPEGVEVVAISTAVSDSQPNFPPAAWLAREKWPWNAIIDDEVGTAAEALGVEGYPFLVFANADGTVAQRYSGEMPVEEFGDAIESIAPEPAAAPAP